MWFFPWVGHHQNWQNPRFPHLSEHIRWLRPRRAHPSGLATSVQETHSSGLSTSVQLTLIKFYINNEQINNTNTKSCFKIQLQEQELFEYQLRFKQSKSLCLMHLQPNWELQKQEAKSVPNLNQNRFFWIYLNMIVIEFETRNFSYTFLTLLYFKWIIQILPRSVLNSILIVKINTIDLAIKTQWRNDLFKKRNVFTFADKNFTPMKGF